MTYDPCRFTDLTPSAPTARTRIRIEETAVIEASIARVWSLVRRFGSGELWLPGLVGCVVEADMDSTTIGAVRRLTQAAPATITQSGDV